MEMLRRGMPLLTIVALAACGGADEEGEVESALPGGAPAAEETPSQVSPEQLQDWSVRLDDESAADAGFQMAIEDGGLQVTTGPAGIAWRPADLVEQGNFTASASFTLLEAPPGHREALGIIVGGRNLQSPDQEYTYFIVRGTGDYMIKRREGSGTENLVGWTASDDVESIAADGADTTNRMSVEVQGDSVRFSVNGTVVETLPTDQVSPWGIAGIRVNHRLNVRVSDWTVTGTVNPPGAASF